MAKNMSAKRALMTSATAVTLSVAMLAGTTLAWFTDSITTSLNAIQSGTLKIGATYRDVDLEGDLKFEVEGLNRNNGEVVFDTNDATDLKDSKLIELKNWEPGAVGAKLITIENQGSLAAKVKLYFNVTDNGLQDALWFDFVKVDLDEGKILGNFEQREMKDLNTLADATEIPLVSKDTEDGNLQDSASFILFYGMKEDAGNNFQDKNFQATVTVLAAQYNYESDDFGSDYDKDTTYGTVYEVNTAEALTEAIDAASNGDAILLTDMVELNAPLNISKDLTIEGVANVQEVAAVDEETETTVTGVGFKGYAVSVKNNANVTFKNVIFDSAATPNSKVTALYINDTASTVVVDGCTFKDAQYQAIQINYTKDLPANIKITNSTFLSNQGTGYAADGKAHRHIQIESVLCGGGHDGKTCQNYDNYKCLLQQKNLKVEISNNTFKNNDNLASAPITIARVDLNNISLGKNKSDGTKSTEGLKYEDNGLVFAVSDRQQQLDSNSVSIIQQISAAAAKQLLADNIAPISYTLAE